MEGEKKILVQSVNKLRVNAEEIGLPVGRSFSQLEFHMVDLERGECLNNYTPPLIKFVPAYEMVSVGNCVYLFCPLDRFQPDDATSLPKLFFGSTRLDLSLDPSHDEVWSSIEVPATVSDPYRRCFSLLGKLYSFGFWKLTPEVLDLDVGFWEPLPRLPPRLQGCSLSAHPIPDPSNNRILLCLDGGQLPSRYLYAFTPLDNKWTPLVPDFHNWTNVAVVVDDVIYFHSRKFPSVIRAFDIVRGRWLTVTWSSSFDDGVDMNSVRMEFDALLPLGGKVLCLAIWSRQFDYDNSLTSNTQISFPKFRVHHNPDAASVHLSPISSHTFVLQDNIEVNHFVAV